MCGHARSQSVLFRCKHAHAAVFETATATCTARDRLAAGPSLAFVRTKLLLCMRYLWTTGSYTLFGERVRACTRERCLRQSAKRTNMTKFEL